MGFQKRIFRKDGTVGAHPFDTFRWVALIVVGAVALVVAALHVRNLFVAAWDHDEIEHLHAAWLVGRGQTPFVDFFEAHQPPLWYVLAPLARVVPAEDLVTVARLLFFPLLVAILYWTYDMVRQLGGRREAAWFATCVLAGTWVFLRTCLEVRPDVVQVFFETLSLNRFLHWTSRQTSRNAVTCGLAAGAAIACLHKAIALVPGLGVGAIVLILGNRQGWRRLVTPLTLLVVSAMLPVAVLYGWMSAKGMLDAYRFLAIDFMAAIQTSTSLPLHFGHASIVWRVFQDSPALFLVGLPGCVLACRRMREPGVAAIGTTLVASLILTAWSRMPFKQYFLPIWVMAAVSSGLFFDRVAAWTSGPLAIGRWFGTLVTVVALALCALGQVFNPTNEFQRTVASRIRSVTGPDDAVFVSPPWHPVDRYDAGYLWFNVPQFLAALAQMEAQGLPMDPVMAQRMREPLARKPRAILISSPMEVEGVPGMRELLSSSMREDEVTRQLFISIAGSN